MPDFIVKMLLGDPEILEATRLAGPRLRDRVMKRVALRAMFLWPWHLELRHQPEFHHPARFRLLECMLGPPGSGVDHDQLATPARQPLGAGFGDQHVVDDAGADPFLGDEYRRLDRYHHARL